jgi:hypothetical protein
MRESGCLALFTVLLQVDIGVARGTDPQFDFRVEGKTGWHGRKRSKRRAA